MSVHAFSGRHLQVASDGTLELSADDAEPLIRAGLRKLGECIIGPDPSKGEQITEPDKLARPNGFSASTPPSTTPSASSAISSGDQPCESSEPKR